MTKRIRKIGIAARLTAVVAVILAVFLVPWVVNTAKQARFDAQDSANSDVNNRFRGIDYRLTEKGYDPDKVMRATRRNTQRNMMQCVLTCVA